MPECEMKPWNEIANLEEYAIENSSRDNEYFLVFNRTGEIRTFPFYRFEGTPEMRRIRALRRLCDCLLRELANDARGG